MSELWWYCDSDVARQISVENHHDENSRRTRKSFQCIQEEDCGTLQNDEEEACQGKNPSCFRSSRKASTGNEIQEQREKDEVTIGKGEARNVGFRSFSCQRARKDAAGIR